MIIGITGKAGAGKTTLANMMVKADKRYERRAFAQPLKTMMNQLGLAIDTGEEKEMTTDIVATEEHVLNGCDMRNGLLTRRGVAQFLGTDLIRRRLDPEFFVKRSFNTSKTDLIFDDVRFANEAIYIKALGGIMIKVNRDVDGSGHISEQLDLDCDHTLNNNYGLEDMDKFARNIMYVIRER